MTGNAAPRRGREVSRALRPTGKALPEDARSHNRSLILRTLFHDGPISRADLARMTGLTRVTVSDVIADLIADGLAEECGTKPGASVGKPATLVGMHADAFHIVAIDLADTDHPHGAVLNLAGDILVREALEMEGRLGSEAIDRLGELISALIAKAERPLLGIGVGSPGVVDEAGMVRLAPNLAWFGIDLAAILQERFALPVYVANDANTAALAEFTFGGASDSSVMVIMVGRGLGSGIVSDGALARGYADAAGEIGHVTAIEDGIMCACGRRGCLETIMSVPALRRAAAGDEKASSTALAEVGRRAGEVLAPVVAALNLKEILLAGPSELLDGPLRAKALETIVTRTMPAISEGLVVRMASLGEDVILAGAAVLVLSGQLGVS